MTDIAPAQKFWMVCRKPVSTASTTKPQQRYGTEAAAETAAAKLATECDAPFLILEATRVIRPGHKAAQGALI